MKQLIKIYLLVLSLSTLLLSSQITRLTIDKDLQNYVKQLTINKSGVVIITELKSANVITLNSFSNDKSKRKINKTIHNLYQPADLIKPITALSILSSKYNKSIKCTGKLIIGQKKFKVNHIGCLGTIDLDTALKNNCDEYFYRQSLNIGIKDLSTNFSNFGFGEKTKIQLKNEFKGTNPNKLWKEKKYKQPWYRGETLMTSVGKGMFLVTPMQISRYITSLANGKMTNLNILKTYQNQDSKKLAYTKKELKFIKEYMWYNCNSKYGRMSKYIDKPYQIAGVESHSKDLKNNTYTWFISYAPSTNPKYSITILLENEDANYYQTIGNITNSIYKKLL